MTIPEVLDGVLQVQDVQDDEEPGPGPPKRDLDLRGPNRLKIKKETTHFMVRWTRVVSVK